MRHSCVTTIAIKPAWFPTVPQTKGLAGKTITNETSLLMQKPTNEQRLRKPGPAQPLSGIVAILAHIKIYANT
jgi:hypothetical protein